MNHHLRAVLLAGAASLAVGAAQAATITYAVSENKTAPIVLTDDSTQLSFTSCATFFCTATQSGPISETGGSHALTVNVSATEIGPDGKGSGTLIFTGANTYTGLTTVTGTRLGSLQIGNNGVTGNINGNIALLNNTNLVFDRSDIYTYAGNISGNGALSQIGSGTTILTGNNSYTGSTTVATGSTLQIDGASALPGNGTFNISGTLAFNNSSPFTLTPASFGGTGTLAVIGTGKVTAVGGLSIRNVSIASGATLQLGNGTTLSNVDLGTVIADNGTLVYNNGGTAQNNVSATLSGNGAIQQSGTDILQLTGDNSAYTGSIIASSGTLILAGTADYAGPKISVMSGATLEIGIENGPQSPSSTRGSISGDITSSGTIVFRRTDAYLYAGSIGGSGNVVYDGKISTARTTLAGNNSFTGSLEVKKGTLTLTGSNSSVSGTVIDNGGTLKIGDGGTTGSVGGNITNNGILTFNRSDTLVESGAISGTGSVNQSGSGTTILTGANSYTGGTFVNNGTLVLAGANPYAGSGMAIAAGSTLQIGQAVANSTLGSVTGNLSASGTIAFARNDGYVYSGSIFGGNIVYLGLPSAAGMTLAGHNTTNGTLAVNSGKLILAGTNDSISTTTIASGATLEISGSLVGPISNAGALVFSPAGSLTESGVISGAGSLTKTGAGTVKLTGANTYTGATQVSSGTLILAGANATAGSSITVASGAILQIGDTVSTSSLGTIAGDIASSGTIAFARNDGYAYSGAISGSGGVQYIGAASANGMTLAGNNSFTGALDVRSGKLFLTGDNAPASGTSIASGATLQIGTGGTTGSLSGNISDSGTLVFNRSNTVTYSGAISGTGLMEKAGSGTLILTGANTFKPNSVFGANTGTLISSGTLQIGNGGTTGTIQSDIANNATLVFNRSDTLVYAGEITGSGAIVQAGTGTLVLNGYSATFGTVSVNAGTLLVGDASHPSADLGFGLVTVAHGATLGGYGRVENTVTSSGTVSPGGSIGTLTFNNGYVQNADGTVAIEVSPTASDRLHVLGNASLNGTLSITTTGVTDVSSFTFLDASSITGQFSQVLVNGASSAVAANVTYTGTSANLTVVPTSTAQLYTDFHRNTYAVAEMVGDAIFDHMRSQVCDDAAPRSRKHGCPEAAIWVQGIGGGGSVDAQGTSDAFSHLWTGAMGGLDYRAEGGLRLGVVASYLTDRMHIAAGRGRATTNSVSVAGTIGLPVLAGQLDADIFYMNNDGNASRPILTATGASRPKSDAVGGAVQFGYPVLADWLSAKVRLNYLHVSQDALVETGASPYDLGVAAKTSSAFFADLGLRAGRDYVMRSGTILTPEVSAGVRLLASAPGTGIGAYLADSPTPTPFTFTGTAMDRTAFTGGLGITAHRRGGFGLFLRADGRVSSHEREGVVSLGASMDL